jgi:hypothetical protein
MLLSLVRSSLLPDACWSDMAPLALPIPGSKVLSANEYGMSLWGQTGKILVELPDGVVETYFLKVSSSRPRQDESSSSPQTRL